MGIQLTNLITMTDNVFASNKECFPLCRYDLFFDNSECHRRSRECPYSETSAIGRFCPLSLGHTLTEQTINVRRANHHKNTDMIYSEGGDTCWSFIPQCGLCWLPTGVACTMCTMSTMCTPAHTMYTYKYLLYTVCL